MASIERGHGTTSRSSIIFHTNFFFCLFVCYWLPYHSWSAIELHWRWHESKCGPNDWFGRRITSERPFPPQNAEQQQQQHHHTIEKHFRRDLLAHPILLYGSQHFSLFEYKCKTAINKNVVGFNILPFDIFIWRCDVVARGVVEMERALYITLGVGCWRRHAYEYMCSAHRLCSGYAAIIARCRTFANEFICKQILHRYLGTCWLFVNCR